MPVALPLAENWPSSSENDRYRLRRSRDGAWLVIDISTNFPVEVCGRILTHMRLAEADKVAVSLNERVRSNRDDES